MSNRAIWDAFCTHMGTMSNGLPILFHGRGGKPPDSGYWLEARHFPNETDNQSWEADSKNAYMGFFQVSVYTRQAIGLDPIQAIAEHVIAHCPKGLELAGVRVKKKPHDSPAIELPDRIFIPVTIHYLGII